MTRFRCVDDQRAAGFPVTAACEAAGVSTSGFYDWCGREAAGPTDREVAEAELVELMREIFHASDGNYGHGTRHGDRQRRRVRMRGAVRWSGNDDGTIASGHLRRPTAPVASFVEVPPGVELLPLSLLESGPLPLAKALERDLMAVAGDVDVCQGRLGGGGAREGGS